MSNDEWGTPRWLYDELDREFCFELDVCASDLNHKHEIYITKEQDSLKQDWDMMNFMNPPHSDQLPWVAKADQSAQFGKTTVGVMMHDPSTAHWREALRTAREIRILNHRIKYEGATGSPKFSTMIAVFRPLMPWEIPGTVGPYVRYADYRYAMPKKERGVK